MIGLKEGDEYHCSRCNTRVTPKTGENEFTQSLPYFLIPEDVKEVLGARPTSLTVVPAYTNLDRTIPNSYARYTRKRKLLCTGDGVMAKRYDPATKRRVDHTACGDDCADYKKGECRPSATFYFYLPDVDVLSGFKLMTKSEATIGNIIGTLKKLTNAEGVLSRMPCELRIVEKRRKSDNKLYRVLELMPPRYSLQQALGAKGGGPVDLLQVAGRIR